MTNRFWLTVLSLVFGVALLCGCGGSSSGGSGGGGIGSGLVAVFATDSMDSNDHVWVTINKIEVNSSGGSQTVFDDANGVVVDLKSLRDPQGNKFQFLSLGSVTGGPFQSATVTMAKKLTVFAAGSQTGTDEVFADQFDDGAGNSRVTFDLERAKNFGKGDATLVIDFDLQNWNSVSGVVTPILKENDGNGLGDDNRNVENEYEGRVSGLTGTAPNQEFDLTRDRNHSFHIVTNADTVVYNSDQSASPELANGERVHVRGIFSIGQASLTATAVKIQKLGNVNEVEARGTPSAAESSTGTFVITIDQVCGFQPGDTTVKVQTDGSTVFRSGRGVKMTKDEFFAALATASQVQAEGSYDAGSNTISAKRCKIADQDHGDGRQVEAHGTTSSLDGNAGTFTLTLIDWDGFNGGAGMTLQVGTAPDTKYVDQNGHKCDRATFFSQITSTGHAEVHGVLNNGSLAASECRVTAD